MEERGEGNTDSASHKRREEGRERPAEKVGEPGPAWQKKKITKAREGKKRERLEECAKG